MLNYQRVLSGYDQHSHGKIHQSLLGKASISMGHGFHGELLNNQRVIDHISRDGVYTVKDMICGSFIQICFFTYNIYGIHIYVYIYSNKYKQIDQVYI